MNTSPTSLEIEFMSRALGLATLGRGHVEPNPMVGCVIVSGDKVIGHGYHGKFGGPHAEPNALANCTQTPAGATAIATLEPCCHTNKKTPPCVPAIISAGITRVVIGQVDPNPEVSGRGIFQLRSAGIQIVTGVLESHCAQLNAPFYALTRLHRPYITLKWAQSADGYMGGTGRTPRQICGLESSRLVHQLRTRSDAIAVSADTVISDNPLLTARGIPIIRQPMRIILDTNLRTPPDCRLLTTSPPATIFTSSTAGHKNPFARIIPLAGKHLDFTAVLRELGEMKLTHLLVEPGPRLAHSLISSGQFDRLWVIRSTNPINEPDAPRAPEISLSPTTVRKVGQDTLSEYLNPRSEAFFANTISPELIGT